MDFCQSERESCKVCEVTPRLDAHAEKSFDSLLFRCRRAAPAAAGRGPELICRFCQPLNVSLGYCCFLHTVYACVHKGAKLRRLLYFQHVSSSNRQPGFTSFTACGSNHQSSSIFLNSHLCIPPRQRHSSLTNRLLLLPASWSSTLPLVAFQLQLQLPLWKEAPTALRIFKCPLKERALLRPVCRGIKQAGTLKISHSLSGASPRFLDKL